MSEPDPQEYYVVDTTTKTILDGPFLWDGVSDWQPPTAGTLMLVTAAEAAGYTWPS